MIGLSIALSPAAPARDTKSLPNYFTRVWQTTASGLPENNVTCVTQTRDGYLWLGTRNGLARFDGVRFKVFDSSTTPEMESRHITALFEADDRTLWIGHDSGEVTAYKDGKFRAVPLKAAWRTCKIASIAADEAGDIWLINQDGELARARDGFVIPLPAGTVAHLLAVARKPGGGFWLQRDSDVAFVSGAALHPIVLSEPNTNKYVQGICACADGGVWIMTEDRLVKWKNNARVADIGPAPWTWEPTHTIIETHDGLLVAATADFGLYIVSPGGPSVHLSRTNGFSSDWVTSLCEDFEGNVWAGTGNGGLAMLRPANVSVLAPPDQWQGRAVLTVAPGRDGALWVGTEGAGLYGFINGAWTNIGEAAGVTHRYVWSVASDPDGHVWAGTWGSGVFTGDNGQFRQAPGLDNLSVGALLPSRAGLFVGTSAGLLKSSAGQITPLAGKSEISVADVRAICQGPDGAVWFGLFGGGLGVVRDGRPCQFRRANGLSSDFVQCLHFDADGSLWIGTFGGGLDRLRNGKFSNIARAQGLPNDVICDIEDDGMGFFWLSSHGGITRVAKADLNECADHPAEKLNCLTFGLDDGLPTLECSGGSQPAGCRTPDGLLWFPTAKGLVQVNPRQVTTNFYRPPVIIEQVRMDGQKIADLSRGDAPLRIPAGRHRLEFDYTGLSFVSPERVRFKYRLDNFDTDWVDAGDTRLADYRYIPYGDYVFHVTACNNDGLWNEEGASLTFSVLPFFWQTWWFRSAAGAAAAAVVAGTVLAATRRRMRRKLDQLERQQAIERERARIAKDIHDDLGASLTRITLLSQTARRAVQDDPQAAADVDRIYGTARELTRAMDEIVWAVNPQHDTLDSLAIYLGKFAQDYLRAAGIRCRLDVPEQLPPWPLSAEIRHNLFLAFKEAIHNVAKHSGATAVRFGLTLQADSFSLTVEDNGRGFNPESVNSDPAADPDRIAPGNGLANMRRRLAEIGGACRLRSAPGGGTRVELDAPVLVVKA